MPKVQAPIALGAFPSIAQERIWIFPFGLVFDPAILDPTAVNYDLYIDTAQTFTTANAMHLTKTSASLINFQEGTGLGKAFEVQMPGRASYGDITWYWQIRINYSTFVSDWSDIRSFVVPQRQDIIQTNQIFANLADENAYAKDANSSNMYKLLLQAGRELDLLLYENNLSISDLSIDMARDKAMANNFAPYLGLLNSGSEVASNFRWKIRKLWDAFAKLPGTKQGLVDVVRAFVGEDPTILDLTQTLGWILDQYFVASPAHPEIQPVIVLYDRPQKGHTFNLAIFNSWNLTYDKNVLEKYIHKMKPPQAQMNLSYSSSRHWSARYNTLSDWQAWTASLESLDLTSTPGTVKMPASGTTTGMLTSPTIQISTITGFDAPFITQSIPDTAHSSITVQYKISADGVNFTNAVTLQHGVVPDSSIAIQQYIKFIINFARSSGGIQTPSLSLFEFRGIRS